MTDIREGVTLGVHDANVVTAGPVKDVLNGTHPEGLTDETDPGSLAAHAEVEVVFGEGESATFRRTSPQDPAPEGMKWVKNVKAVGKWVVKPTPSYHQPVGGVGVSGRFFGMDAPTSDRVYEYTDVITWSLRSEDYQDI